MRWSLNLPPVKKRIKNKAERKDLQRSWEKPHGLSRQWAQEKPDLERQPGGATGMDPVFFTLLLTIESILLISVLPHCRHFTVSTSVNEVTMVSNSALQVEHLNS